MKEDNHSKKSVFLAVAIGILSAALWEIIINPVGGYIFSKFIIIINPFLSGYVNSIYEAISRGEINYHSVNQVLLFIALYILIFFLFYLRLSFSEKEFYDLYNETDDDLKDLKYIDFRTFTTNDIQDFNKYKGSLIKLKKDMDKGKTSIIQTKKNNFKMLLIVIFIFIFLNLENIFICQETFTTLNNIEIVSPYISDQEYKKLKSNFYSMTSKNDYTELCDSINQIAEVNGIELKN